MLELERMTTEQHNFFIFSERMTDRPSVSANGRPLLNITLLYMNLKPTYTFIAFTSLRSSEYFFFGEEKSLMISGYGHGIWPIRMD